MLRFEGIRENECFVSNAPGKDAKVPSYAGGKFPLSTYLAEQVRGMLADPDALEGAAGPGRRLAAPAGAKSRCCRRRDDLLVETFPRGNRLYMVAYPFEGRLAHQTLGMLLTRRLERAGARPLGFVATDYALAVWALGDMGAMFKRGKLSLGDLFDEDMLGDDLEAWLADSWLLKRTFRNCALISGPDREAPSRPGEERPAGHGLGRPHLRRAAQPRAGPHPAAGDARRCGDRPARCQEACRHAVAHPRPNHA